MRHCYVVVLDGNGGLTRYHGDGGVLSVQLGLGSTYLCLAQCAPECCALCSSPNSNFQGDLDRLAQTANCHISQELLRRGVDKELIEQAIVGFFGNSSGVVLMTDIGDMGPDSCDMARGYDGRVADDEEFPGGCLGTHGIFARSVVSSLIVELKAEAQRKLANMKQLPVDTQR